MHKQLQRLAMFTTLAIGTSALSVTPALATPTAQDQDHHDQYQKDRNEHPEYVNNKYYQLGNKEGYEDHKKTCNGKSTIIPTKPTWTSRSMTRATSRDGRARTIEFTRAIPTTLETRTRSQLAAGEQPAASPAVRSL